MFGVFAFADRRRNFDGRGIVAFDGEVVDFVNDFPFGVEDRDVIGGRAFDLRPLDRRGRLRRGLEVDENQARRYGKSAADREDFGRLAFGFAVGVGDFDFDAIFAVEVELAGRASRFRDGLGFDFDEGRFFAFDFGFDDFVNRNDVTGNGFVFVFGFDDDGVPSQRNGRVCGLVEDVQQVVRRGRNVRVREFDFGAKAFARVVLRDDAVFVRRAELEFVGRPAFRAGRELPLVRGRPEAVFAEFFDAVAVESVFVRRPGQRNGLVDRNERSRDDDRSRRRRDRFELDGSPFGIAVAVGRADLIFVGFAVLETERMGRNVRVDGSGVRPRFAAVGRVAEFIAFFAEDVAPGQRRFVRFKLRRLVFQQIAAEGEVRRSGRSDLRSGDFKRVIDRRFRAFVDVVNANVVVARRETFERKRLRRRDFGVVGEFVSGGVEERERKVRVRDVAREAHFNVVFGGRVGRRREFEVVHFLMELGRRVDRLRPASAEVGRGCERVVVFVLVRLDVRRGDRQGIGGFVFVVGILAVVSLLDANVVRSRRNSFKRNRFRVGATGAPVEFEVSVGVVKLELQVNRRVGRRFEPRAVENDRMLVSAVDDKFDFVIVFVKMSAGDRFDRRRFGQRSKVVRGFERVVRFGFEDVFRRRVRDGERGQVDDRRFVGLSRSDFGARGDRFEIVERRNAQKSAIFQGFKTQVARSVLFFIESFAQRGSVTGSVEKFHVYVSGIIY